MDRDEVVSTYDDAYAEAYDERYVLAPWPKHGFDVEIGILRDLIGPGDRWIDLGCGTGWALSQFPDVERAGLDLSPSMLAQARAANPDIPLHHGDFTHDVEEFHGAWDVVSCMWMAYCYLASMPECEALVANMVRWTAEGGSAFLPSVIDLEDLRPHQQVAYEEYPDVWGGRIAITGHYWTWEEPSGQVNTNMMAPHVGHFVRLLEPHFEKVEVVRYPLFGPGHVSRKAVVATGRRPAGTTGEAEVIWHPVPEHPDDVAAREAEQEAARAAAEAERIAAADAREAEVRAELEAEAHARASELERQLAVARHEADYLRETYGHLPPPAADGSVHLGSTGTKRLAVELARRVNPLRRLKRG